MDAQQFDDIFELNLGQGQDLEAAINGESLIELEQVPGHWTSHVNILFDKDQRKLIASDRVAAKTNEIDDCARAATAAMRKIHRLMPRTSEALLEFLGPRDYLLRDSKGKAKTRRFYSAVTQNTQEYYSTAIAEMLRMFVAWADLNEQQQQQTRGLCFSPVSRAALVHFKNELPGIAADDDAAAENVFLVFRSLMQAEHSASESYESDPVSASIIAAIFDEASGDVVHTATGNRWLNAAKFFLRGSAMMHIRIAHQPGQDMEELGAYAMSRTGYPDVMGNLNRLHGLISSFHRPIPANVQLGKTPGSLKIDGFLLGAPEFFRVLHSKKAAVRAKLTDLLQGFDPRNDDAAKAAFPVLLDGADPHEYANVRDSAHYTCGAASAADARRPLLANFVSADPVKRDEFFEGAADHLLPRFARCMQYLNECMALEKDALSLFHVALGATMRGESEFELLRFRNLQRGGSTQSGRRHIHIKDASTIMVEGANMKMAHVANKHLRKLHMAPRDYLDDVLVYWAVVRPFAYQLVAQLRNMHAVLTEAQQRRLDALPSSIHWYSFAFVRAHGDYVRRTVSAAFGAGIRWNHLRHAACALFKEHVEPFHLSVAKCYATDEIFGHSRAVGARYGVVAG